MARRRQTSADLQREIDRLRALLRAEPSLVHELEVQHEQLAVQRDHLIRVQHDLETSRDRYADLFDFSPVAYVGIDRHGIIKEINLTGARLLGGERQRVLGFPLVTFVTRGHCRPFLDHLAGCRSDGAVHEC